MQEAGEDLADEQRAAAGVRAAVPVTTLLAVRPVLSGIALTVLDGIGSTHARDDIEHGVFRLTSGRPSSRST